ncbi:MAG: HipA domain-containing protein [Alphaproteobacteria bacterium]|nr:HipA domain-containing protein [Alphaproteobacteria bacterium]
MAEELAKVFGEAGQSALGVYWYGLRIGTLTRVPNTKSVQWQGHVPELFHLFDVQDANEQPAVIGNMQPEGWLFDVLNYRDQWDYLENGLAFLSNLRIVAPDKEDEFLSLAPRDTRKGRLQDFSAENGVFSGQYLGPSQEGIHQSMSQSVAAFWNDRAMPRLSGAQMKLPMCLHEDGRLVPAKGGEDSFTHILKLPGGGNAEKLPTEGNLRSIGALEWFCLRVSEKVGINTAGHTLVPLPHGLPPAVLVERFDIPENEGDSRQILMQDMCSLAKIPSYEKDSGSIEKCASLVKKVSTDWEQDKLALFDRVVLSYALRDGDMHRKNLSVLKTIEGSDFAAASVRFAPAYDIVSTVVYKNADQMMLPLNGKKDGFSDKTWECFGKFLGMNGSAACERAKTLMERIAAEAVALCRTLPPEITAHPDCVYALQRATTEIVDLVCKSGVETPEWNLVRDPTKQKPNLADFQDAQRRKARARLGIAEESASARSPFAYPSPSC